MDAIEKKIKLENISLLDLFGVNESYLSIIENRFKSLVMVRGNNLVIKGEPDEVKVISLVFKELLYMLKRNGKLSSDDVFTVLNLIDVNKITPKENGSQPGDNEIYEGRKEIIKARTPKQVDYYQKVLKNDLVFAIGPAGTGKTFLAVAMALAALRNNEVSRIILTRPAVEAGESLGFLPGDMREKIDPYIRPLFDALQFMLTSEKLKILLEKNIIEITPLAYMRGRTLNNSFIILDEAQNATKMQMKMFLTRLGANSKAIVTGDVSQIDLAKDSMSGLIDAAKILKDVKGIEFAEFTDADVVRHPLVARIIKAYDKFSD
jgi:phosphate starvation-inducible PhoH-like protein